MSEALAQILEQGQALFLAGFLVFLRVGASMTMLPAFGESVVPQRVKLGLALALSAAVVPIVAGSVPTLQSFGPLISLYLASEVIIGLGMGFMLRLFVIALQTAGSIAAQATSLSQIFAGASVEPMPAIGHVLVAAGLALAAIFGLHVKIVAVMAQSYQVFPVGTFPGSGAFTDWGVFRIAKAFALAFSLAAPFVIASLIYNLALGVINKAMPQLMVSFVGAPALTAGGLILLFLAGPMLLEIWLNVLRAFIADPFGMS